MRRMLTMGLALAIITVSSLSVDAGGYYRRSSASCTDTECGQSRVYYYKKAEKKNFFAKLWEMEKKKNAWLKKTFLGG